jgi:hypothetical protein
MISSTVHQKGYAHQHHLTYIHYFVIIEGTRLNLLCITIDNGNEAN